MRRQRYEAKAAEERVWAEAKAVEEQALRDAELHEYEWRRKAHEEAATAESWREEQRQAEARQAWGDAWAQAEMRRTFREMHGGTPPVPYSGVASPADQVGYDRTLPPEAFAAPRSYAHPASPPGILKYPTSPAGSLAMHPAQHASPDQHARLLAAESAAAEAMAALARVQKEVHGAATMESPAQLH